MYIFESGFGIVNYGTLYLIWITSEIGFFSSLEENLTKSLPQKVVPILYPFFAIKIDYLLKEVNEGPYILIHIGLKLFEFLNTLKGTLAVPNKESLKNASCHNSIKTCFEWFGRIVGKNTIWLNCGFWLYYTFNVYLCIPPYFIRTYGSTDLLAKFIGDRYSALYISAIIKWPTGHILGEITVFSIEGSSVIASVIVGSSFGPNTSIVAFTYPIQPSNSS